MLTTVFSLGGSLLFKEGKLDVEFFKAIADLFKEFSRKEKIFVCVGGGYCSRLYATGVREISGNEFLADEAAILATRSNAFALIAAIGVKAYARPVTDFNEAKIALDSGLIGVGAGIIPGITTDADASMFAERLGAKRLINLSTSAVYCSDPKKNPKAKKFDSMTHVQLAQLALEQDNRNAKSGFIFDILACKLCKRSNIEIVFIEGQDLKQVKAAFNNEKHNGTIVRN
ncbi:MAG: UMP kinase [Candidatus Micrarchaeota archaeon]